MTLHPTAAGRIYAAYGGAYIAVAIFWLWLVDDVRPTRWDLVGAGVCLIGMAMRRAILRNGLEGARSVPPSPYLLEHRHQCPWLAGNSASAG